jgi:hypothetical protein
MFVFFAPSATPETSASRTRIFVTELGTKGERESAGTMKKIDVVQ